jgi:hypothetical protein
MLDRMEGDHLFEETEEFIASRIVREISEGGITASDSLVSALHSWGIILRPRQNRHNCNSNDDG